MLKHYCSVVKPGIIIGNMIAAIAGYLFASKGSMDWLNFVAMILGTSFVIACGCVVNNIFDKDIDKLMERTKSRALAIGALSEKAAVSYAMALGLIGFGTLFFFSTLAALSFAILGFVVYAGLYTFKYKRGSKFGTLIGSISGACPPVIGYCAVTGSFDLGALTLLLIFCLWQIPHSYAIAIYRFDDYKKAGIPIMPIVQGIPAARKHMMWYIVAFTLTSLMLFVLNYVGVFYAIFMSLVGVAWLLITAFAYKQTNDQLWAKRVFLLSLVAIISLSVVISTDYVQVIETGTLVLKGVV
ncbi:protoheme IX farnesyltransferase [Pseudoalteromonas phenolica]|uniref:Protoheme IX farnesyltransferase n=1 Tax=Pseudoalteromonas phenolica TaxID=161398 RepID=A0A4Q7IMT2_9GAMM|nr:heme o synthase [Pseudoalteromonas phenolica]RZQ52656.1 protoheme IX farnesyltransferase [Pseudoalteromonas phenolica]